MTTASPSNAATLPLEPVRLSIIVPVLNESASISYALGRLLHAAYPCATEFIVVDDGSTDETPKILDRIDDPRLVVRRHAVNHGKGAAVLTGLKAATGTHALIFDADLEYDPVDIPRLVQPILDGKATAVYGTRIFGNETVYQSFWYALGNKATTFAANILFDAAITDLHTCLKLVPLPLIHSLRLSEQGFGLDTQLTARLLSSGVRPYEVPVSYNSRTRDEGKKIGWRNGVECLAILIRERHGARRRPVWLRASQDVAHFDRMVAHQRLTTRDERRLHRDEIWVAPSGQGGSTSLVIDLTATEKSLQS